MIRFLIRFLNATAWVSIAMMIVGCLAGFTHYRDTMLGDLFPAGVFVFLMVGLIFKVADR